LKNLVLTGFNRIGLYFDIETTDNINVFLSGGSASFETAEKALKMMNPKLELSMETDLEMKDYSLVIVNGMVDKWIDINKKCRNANIPFLCMSCHGFYSLMFVDGGEKYEFLTKENDKDVSFPVSFTSVESLFGFKVPDPGSLSAKKLKKLVSPELVMMLAMLESDSMDSFDEKVKEKASQIGLKEDYASFTE
jgi:hypothetical protein